jgi:hypothetical protein
MPNVTAFASARYPGFPRFLRVRFFFPKISDGRMSFQRLSVFLAAFERLNETKC